MRTRHSNYGFYLSNSARLCLGAAFCVALTVLLGGFVSFLVTKYFLVP